MKIDTSKIEGYADMSPEEKLAALEGFEYDDFSAEVTKLKGNLTKANSEAAEWKKKHNALLSEEELKKQEFEDMKNTVKQLTAEKDLANHKANFIALGYDDALAADTAKALLDGDMTKVFANQKLFQEQREKQIKADALKDIPDPPPGEPGKGVSKEDLRKMSPVERYNFSIEHPDEYKKIYGGNT